RERIYLSKSIQPLQVFGGQTLNCGLLRLANPDNVKLHRKRIVPPGSPGRGREVGFYAFLRRARGGTDSTASPTSGEAFWRLRLVSAEGSRRLADFHRRSRS